MKKTVLLSLVFSLLLPASSVFADFSVKTWAKERNISVSRLAEPGYVRVKLDRFVGAGSNQFKDVRVIHDADGVEVPYQLVVKDASVTFASLPSKIVDEVTDSSGRLMFILDLESAGPLHSQLNIVASSANYRRQVSVYATSSLLPHSSDGWNILTDKGYIFKFTNQNDGFHTEHGFVTYPESSARYLRVVVEGGPEGALSLITAGVNRQEISFAEEETENIAAEVTENQKDQTTEVIADLGASGIPTKRIELSVTDQGNFSRSAFLSGSKDGTNWSRIGGGYFSQIATAKFTGKSLSIDYPESSYRYYKVTVQNFDDAPLHIGNRVKITNTVRTVVFEAVPGAAYKLYYGNKSAYAPRYDLSRYFEYLDTATLPEATLGGEHDNASYVPPAPPVVPFTERNKILLNVTLAILSILIAAVIFFYIGRHVHAHPSTTPTAAPAPSAPSTPAPTVAPAPATPQAPPTSGTGTPQNPPTPTV